MTNVQVHRVHSLTSCMHYLTITGKLQLLQVHRSRNSKFTLLSYTLTVVIRRGITFRIKYEYTICIFTRTTCTLLYTRCRWSHAIYSIRHISSIVVTRRHHRDRLIHNSMPEEAEKILPVVIP